MNPRNAPKVAVYIVQNGEGHPEDVFLSNDDECSPAQIDHLKRRLRRIGFSLVKRAAEPISELADWVDALERENVQLGLVEKQKTTRAATKKASR